jgi:hypothetical protein
MARPEWLQEGIPTHASTVDVMSVNLRSAAGTIDFSEEIGKRYSPSWTIFDVSSLSIGRADSV